MTMYLLMAQAVVFQNNYTQDIYCGHDVALQINHCMYNLLYHFLLVVFKVTHLSMVILLPLLRDLSGAATV